MGQALFYHLTRRPLEATLPMLLTKSRQAGWNVVVRGTTDARINWLDQRLWAEPEDGFMAHGQAGGDHDAQQPILLTTKVDMPNNPSCLISIDGAAISAPEVEALARVCVLFDGNDAAALATAREQWKLLTSAGCSAQYWSEDSGAWKMKAEA